MSYTFFMAEQRDKVTLYIPKDLQQAVREALKGTGITLSELTRQLYFSYISSEAYQGVNGVQHGFHTPESKAEFYQLMGRQFHRLAMISVNIDDRMKERDAQHSEEGEHP